MPVAVSYPGVYIEEIPSGVRTITGVATSVTAFLGRAITGPVDTPVTCNSYGDFERAFGGLGVDYPMSYAVRDFYLNGGSTALIVRLYKNPVQVNEAYTQLTFDGLTLQASSQGSWAKKLRATIDFSVSEEVRTRLHLGTTDALFNLTVKLGGASEKFLNLTLSDNARRIDRVLQAESNWLRWPKDVAVPSAPLTVYAAVNTALATVAVKLKDLDEAKKLDPPNATKVTEAQESYDASLVALEDAKKLIAANLPTEIPAAAWIADRELADAFKSNKLPDIAAARQKLKDAEAAMLGDDGLPLDDAAYQGNEANKTGLHALDKADLFNLLCIPPDTRDGDISPTVYQATMAYCALRRAVLVVDPPTGWDNNPATAAATARDGLAALGLSGPAARNAALYFPRLLEADPLRDGQTDSFVPCGAVAGIMARTDSARGVWKAPAGLDAAINGIQGLAVNLNDAENGMLNPLGINCLRAFPINGRVVWGARTLRGADQLADEYKYVSVRRTALFIEESLYRGTQWVVFEPNDEPLWSQIRLNVGAFMNGLFRQGAFQGKTPQEAYFVKCDKETTPQNDINLGIVNIVVGFAPLKPAEFVIVKLQQIAGQIQV